MGPGCRIITQKEGGIAPGKEESIPPVDNGGGIEGMEAAGDGKEVKLPGVAADTGGGGRGQPMGIVGQVIEGGIDTDKAVHHVGAEMEQFGPIGVVDGSGLLKGPAAGGGKLVEIPGQHCPIPCHPGLDQGPEARRRPVQDPLGVDLEMVVIQEHGPLEKPADMAGGRPGVMGVAEDEMVDGLFHASMVPAGRHSDKRGALAPRRNFIWSASAVFCYTDEGWSLSSLV